MISDIITGMANALYEEFGDSYKIYTERREQGLKEPCFFVFTTEPARDHFFWNRYFQRNPMCIQYFPPDRCKARESCLEVADRLMDCMELITVSGDPMRGEKMNFEIVDNVLMFFVSYDLFLKAPYETDYMETLDHDIDARD